MYTHIFLYTHTYLTAPSMELFRTNGNDETNNVNEHNIVKNPNWQEADQLAIGEQIILM